MIASTKDAVVRARIDRKLKEQAACVLAAMGLTVSDVLREVMIRWPTTGRYRSKSAPRSAGCAT